MVRIAASGLERFEREGILKPTKVENVFVNNAEENTHVKTNQEVIREYLIEPIQRI